MDGILLGNYIKHQYRLKMSLYHILVSYTLITLLSISFYHYANTGESCKLLSTNQMNVTKCYIYDCDCVSYGEAQMDKCIGNVTGRCRSTDCCRVKPNPPYYQRKDDIFTTVIKGVQSKICLQYGAQVCTRDCREENIYSIAYEWYGRNYIYSSATYIEPSDFKCISPLIPVFISLVVIGLAPYIIPY